MPQYEYHLYLFTVEVFDATGQKTKKPAWLWKQVTVNSAVNFKDVTVFDNWESMLLGLQNSGLLDSTTLAEADRSFRAGAWFDSTVYVPFGKEGAIQPNLSPEPGYVIPSKDFARKVKQASESRNSLG
jgi:hypothetical protein